MIEHFATNEYLWYKKEVKIQFGPSQFPSDQFSPQQKVNLY